MKCKFYEFFVLFICSDILEIKYMLLLILGKILQPPNNDKLAYNLLLKLTFLKAPPSYTLLLSIKINQFPF